MSDATTGRYYDEMAIGDAFTHAIRKTITRSEFLLLNALSCGAESIEMDPEYLGQRSYTQSTVGGVLAIAWTRGIGIDCLTMSTAIGDIEINEVMFVRPLKVCDTIRAESEILDKRDSMRTDAGIIEVECRAYNQRNELVNKFRCLRIVMKRPLVT